MPTLGVKKICSGDFSFAVALDATIAFVGDATGDRSWPTPVRAAPRFRSDVRGEEDGRGTGSAPQAGEQSERGPRHEGRGGPADRSRAAAIVVRWRLVSPPSPLSVRSQCNVVIFKSRSYDILVEICIILYFYIKSTVLI